MPLAATKDFKQLLEKNIKARARLSVMRRSRGNVALQRGKYRTEQQMNQLRQQVTGARFLEGLEDA